MKLLELWIELERRAPHERVGRMVQRIHPESTVDLFATVEVRGGDLSPKRALELHVDRSALEWADVSAQTHQVSASIESRDSDRSALVLGLDDLAASDLFAAMCTDVAAATAVCAGDEDAVSAWLGRFAKWRKMLQGSSEGLAPRRQRGLFAELLTIRDHLIPRVGLDEAVRGWKGPDGAPRDFELHGCGIEVKSSAANEPQVVPVHGERQLDDSELDDLVLVHQSLEVLRDSGETLPTLVAELRDRADGLSEAATFEDRLLQSGYADVHEPLYRRTGYAIRRTSFFRVCQGFPRITEKDLVDGVGAVRYSLAIDACRDHEVAETIFAETLGMESNKAEDAE